MWTEKDGSDLPPEIVEAVKSKFDECFEKAKTFFGREFKDAEIIYGVTGTTAGWACYPNKGLAIV